MPEDMPDRMPEDLPDRMPEDMPQDIPYRMPDRMPEDMSDRMPEDLPVSKCINVMVGITRSKVIFYGTFLASGPCSCGVSEIGRFLSVPYFYGDFFSPSQGIFFPAKFSQTGVAGKQGSKQASRPASKPASQGPSPSPARGTTLCPSSSTSRGQAD